MQGGLPEIEEYQNCSDFGERRRLCEALRAQALECLAHCSSCAGLDGPATAPSASNAQQPSALRQPSSVPAAQEPSSFDIEQGAPVSSGSGQPDESTAEHSEWQLSAESRSSSARGASTLVFVNPRALFKALNKYSMAVTDRFTGTAQHTHSSDSPHCMPGSAQRSIEQDGGSQEEGGNAQQMRRSTQLLASARCLLLQQVQALEALATEHGYTESLLHSDSLTENEEYTNRHASPRLPAGHSEHLVMPIDAPTKGVTRKSMLSAS